MSKNKKDATPVAGLYVRRKRQISLNHPPTFIRRGARGAVEGRCHVRRKSTIPIQLNLPGQVACS